MVRSIKGKKAFTLVEMMIVVGVIGILLGIAIPGYLKYRTITKRTICINNLKQIDGAIDQWAFEHEVSEGIDLTPEQEEEIYANLKGGKPTCPSGGTYTITTVGASPQVTCSIEGHVLP